MKWNTVAYLFSALAHKYLFLALGSILIVKGKSVNSRALISLIFNNRMRIQWTVVKPLCMQGNMHTSAVSFPACLRIQACQSIC